jgi:hypothetical protein
MADLEQTVTASLANQADLRLLGSCFTLAYPVESAECFGELLCIIDEVGAAVADPLDRAADETRPTPASSPFSCVD